MLELLERFLPIGILACVLLLLIVACLIYFVLLDLRSTLVQHRKVQDRITNELRDISAHAHSLPEAIARLVEVQETALSRIHKIAIHYAPYLRSRADVMHEEDHRDNIHHDLDIDAEIERERVERRTLLSTGWNPVELNPTPGKDKQP